MPELKPLPIATLVRRVVHEFTREQRIFDLPATRFWRGAEEINPGVRSHGKPAGTPFGPAAGPHTQMAQNIVLGWLAGARIIELKTIQVNDRLTIPRPCIDAANVCYNVEFSQELRLEQSLEEYVKAWMLVRIIEELGFLGVPARSRSTAPGEPPHFYDCIFDMSCGYNLEGIASERVQWFIRSMMDAREEIERLRRQIPDEFAALREIDFEPHIVSTATLSTFHGCPPDEIEGIVEHLLRVNGLHVVIKMNPTMLGRARVEELLHDVLGYAGIEVNPAAFKTGLQFDQAVALVRRLRRLGHERGLHVGVKFTNTLEVLNHRDFFPPSEKVMYLSGPPLYPIAMELATRFVEAYAAGASEEWDAALPVSFSAGVDKHNFADCVAAGMAPVTVCTDMLKVGGYGRAVDYLQALAGQMKEVGAASVDEFIVRRAGAAASARNAAARANMREAWQKALSDPHYTHAKNSLVPRRVGSRLWLFDCLTCDKCIPVCPNNANFTYPASTTPVEYFNWKVRAGRLERGEAARFALRKPRQIANFGQFCNECGNCDTYCPEEGGPYVEKPTFFSDVADWAASEAYDGFVVEHEPGRDCIRGRIGGATYTLIVSRRGAQGEVHEFESPAGRFTIDPVTLELEPLELRVTDGDVGAGTYLMLSALLRGVLDTTKINYVNAGFADILPPTT
jgi:putative selenate reductase